MIKAIRAKAELTAAIFFPIYLAMVLLTDYSLTGYWTDVVFSVVFSIYALKLSFKNEIGQLWMIESLIIINVATTLIVYGLLVVNIINPFAWDVFKLRSFYFQQVDGRLFKTDHIHLHKHQLV